MAAGTSGASRTDFVSDHDEFSFSPPHICHTLGRHSFLIFLVREANFLVRLRLPHRAERTPACIFGSPFF